MNADQFDVLRRQLAESIRAARRKVGLSQEALALEADVDRTYVSQLERGIANPSLLILYRLAQILGGELSVKINPPERKENPVAR